MPPGGNHDADSRKCVMMFRVHDARRQREEALNHELLSLGATRICLTAVAHIAEYEEQRPATVRQEGRSANVIGYVTVGRTVPLA
jgi:hypothetical protein